MSGSIGDAVAAGADLETMLPPKEEFVTLSTGDKIKVEKMRIGMLAPVLKAANPLFAVLKKAAVDANKMEATEGVPVSPVEKTDMLGLMEEHTPAVIETVAILTRMPITAVEDLPLDDVILLATKVLEVNLDFFMQRVLPQLSGALSGTTALVRARQLLVLGQTASSN